MPQSTSNAVKTQPIPPHKASPFKLARVEKADVPDASRGQHWYRYVLDNGRSQITGQRKGSLKDVTAHATRYAEQLNTRAFGAHSVWSARRTDPSKAKPPVKPVAAR